MEDEMIVDLYWQRSDLAISETDKKYGRYCHSIAYNICGTDEDAEECVNDTWLRAWNLMPDQRPAVLSAFLGRITRNIAINCIKAKTRLKRGGGEAAIALDELEECIPGGTEPERVLEEKELETAIGSFVSGLSDAERTVFVLRYWYVASIDEISKKLRFSKGKIKSILFRTRGKLRRYLQEEKLC
ncbi:MAG: sigma-70 family RNA polymerase sigma factor [Oscillospiraceae bacterium]|nr:sigma-70 family RNA polymerase sigma factor [Oscillospiraceae bacterium]